MLRTVADCVGSALPFTSKKGKTYQITPMDLNNCGAFEKWLEARAFDSVERHLASKSMETTEYAKILAAVGKEFAAGDFAFGGEIANRATKSIPGILKLISITMGVDQKEASDLLINEGVRIVQAMNGEIEASMPEVPEGKEEPVGTASA